MMLKPRRMRTGLCWLTCYVLQALLPPTVNTIDTVSSSSIISDKGNKARDMVPAIQIPDRPQTIISPDPDIYTLECKATGEPQPTYKWTFNGNDITEAMSVDTNTGTLTITEFSEEEEGRYQCSAQNTIRGEKVTTLSHVITLKEARIDNWISDVVDVTTYEGDYVYMTCDNPPLSVPSGKYYWYRNTEEGKENIEENNRIHIDAEGSLHILNVTKEDARTYMCAVHNPSLDLIKLGSEKHVTVNETGSEKHVTVNETGSEATEEILRFKTKSTTRFLLTTEAELECVYSGGSDTEVTWLDPNGNLINTSDKYTIDDTTRGRRLVVNDLTEDDEGNFTCMSASGQAGHVWLDVTSPPIWVQSLNTQTVPENRDAKFTCKARPAVGDKPLNPTKWLLNGDPLNIKDNPRFKLNGDGMTLIVTNLNKTTDVMCFQCNVSNDIGFQFGDGCLNVIKPILLESFPDLQQNISKGEIINLTVTGSVDPDYPQQYRWRFNDDILDFQTNHFHVVFNETSKEAYINTSTLTDEEYIQTAGTYHIELYNNYDSVAVSTQVVLTPESGVEDVVPVVPVVPVATAGIQSGDLWWISIVIAGVLCILIVIIVIIICRRTLCKKRVHKAVDKANIMGSFDPLEDYESRLSIEPESLDTEAEASERDAWSQTSQSDDDMDARDFDEDGSFIGNYELSRFSLNRI